MKKYEGLARVDRCSNEIAMVRIRGENLEILARRQTIRAELLCSLETRNPMLEALYMNNTWGANSRPPLKRK